LLEVLLWVLVMLLLVMLELGLGGMLVVLLRARKLGQVGRVDVELGVGRRGGVIVGIKLVGDRLGTRVEDDDVALFKVLYEGVEVLEVETAAGIVAAKLIFALHGGKGIHDGTSVGLDGGRDLSCTAEVGGV
jgi:hypothetical protein